MPKNIDDFNTGVALILGKLYENFPNAIQLNPSELHTLEYSDSDPLTDEKINRNLELYEIYYHTAFFLLDEGYIRGRRIDGYTVINECTLTSKGLAVLQRVPESIQGKKRSVGDFLIDLSKDGLKTVTKEAVKIAVSTVLGND